jgi:hypothetical protein
VNLTPAELAARIRTDEGTLANWRCQGRGPAFWKPSARKVLYRLIDVEAWERERAS